MAHKLAKDIYIYIYIDITTVLNGEYLTPKVIYRADVTNEANND